VEAALAQRVIESLRMGIPPEGHIGYFTVGRKAEIAQLTSRLTRADSGALLVKANYGSGKTHLLRFIREEALRNDFAVSAVTLDAKGAVRFNRMDQVFGAICRNIEIPSAPGQKGIRPFFDSIIARLERSKSTSTSSFWNRLTNNWQWDYSEELDSNAMFLALRAWAAGSPAVRDTVEDWLFQPWTYQSQRKKLYAVLVEGLRRHFRAPRPEWQFYAHDVFRFDSQGYDQSWAARRALHTLSRESGLKGLIILFDEFEDVVTNLRNVAHQEAAFWNLFQFYAGKQFPGMTYYAVTPEFVEKCIQVLINKGRWDYDYTRFTALPTFHMSPLEVEELRELASRIALAHGDAYGWDAAAMVKRATLAAVVKKAATVQIQDRARHTIVSVVKTLDAHLEDVA
jgi:hypothetical protein